MLIIILFFGAYVLYKVINALMDEIEEDRREGRKRKFWEY